MNPCLSVFIRVHPWLKKGEKNNVRTTLANGFSKKGLLHR